MDQLSISTATTASDKSQDLGFSPTFSPSYPAGHAKSSLSPLKPKRMGMKFEGHRGAGLLEPENTLKAFQRAIDLDLDGIELDVWLSADGIPIIIHGTDEGLILFKEANYNTHVNKVHSQDLKNWMLPTGECIPTLEEVLVLCKDKMRVNIELKEDTNKVIKPVLELLVRLEMLDQVCFSSFIHAHKTWLEEGKRELEIKETLEFGFLVWQNQDFKEYLAIASEGDSLNIDIDLLLKQEAFILDEISKARAKNLRIKFYFGFEIEESDELYRRLESMFIDTLIINHPEKSTVYLRQLLAH